MLAATPSAAPPISERARAAIAAIVAMLDPDYPAVVIPPAAGSIDEAAAGYTGAAKPDFIAQDELGWGNPYE